MALILDLRYPGKSDYTPRLMTVLLD